MQVTSHIADHIVDAAVAAASTGREALVAALEQLPAAVYVTDRDGTITYYNRACIALAGRTPTVGQDRWCVTWKLFTMEGQPLPHDQCPMAVAIREKRPLRNIEAVAERPDGTRVKFMPYPTPLFDPEGSLVGGVNLLVDSPEKHKPEYLREQAARCRRLASDATEAALAEMLNLMAAKYDEQAVRLARSNLN